MPTLVTLTSDRPEAFALCERWMAAQDYRDDYDWIVVDDGQTPAQPSRGQCHIRREHTADGLESFRANLRCALECCGDANILVFIEDDVWYRHDYLSFVLDGLKDHDAVGEARCRDYNVATQKHRICSNTRHASLCQTAIRRAAVPLLMGIVDTLVAPNIDQRFWLRLKVTGLCGRLFANSEHSVNIKGMPGKTGLIGHGMFQGKSDEDSSRLRLWCGEDAGAYREFRK